MDIRTYVCTVCMCSMCVQYICMCIYLSVHAVYTYVHAVNICVVHMCVQYIHMYVCLSVYTYVCTYCTY